MSFETLSDFFLMGGHALYVWLSYGVGFFIILVVYIQPILKRRTILQELSQRQRRDAQYAQQMMHNVENEQTGEAQ